MSRDDVKVLILRLLATVVTAGVLGLSAYVVAACAMTEIGPDLADAKSAPDPIVIDTVLPAVASITVGQPLQLCWFGGFKSGRFAMRAQDTPRCEAAYRAAFDSAQRAVNKNEQRAADAAVVTWSAVMDVQL